MVNSGLLETFAARAGAAGAEVFKFSGPAAAIDFAAGLFAREGLSAVVASPEAGRLAEGRFPLFEAKAPEDFARAQAGIVAADFGVAETGTLLRLDSRDEEKLAWTFPPLCVCLLRARTIVPRLEDLAGDISRHLAGDGVPGPQVSLITGPSRTADIEGLLSIGVHGPSRLVILLIEEELK